MALEFAEFLRNFVPLGVGADLDALTENTLLEDLVGSGKTVLEIVRGETLGDALPANGCSVTLADASALEHGENSSDPALSAKYDVVVLSDVLAYVREPVRLLRQCRRLLNGDGFIVAAMPNFGYGALRLALLSGTYDDFAREQEANPRLHFFTLDLIQSLLNRAGYRIEQTLRRTMRWDATLSEPRYTELGEAIVNQIRRDPEHETLTYLIKATPLVSAVAGTELREDAPDALKARLGALEARLEAASTENAELREAGRALRDQLAGLRRRAHVAGQLQSALDSALMDLADAFKVRDDLLVRLHTADSALRDLAARRQDLERSCMEIERSRSEIERSRAEVERTLNAVKSQNAELAQRAQAAERTAFELASEMLQSTKAEVQQLSDLIDVVQRSRFWRVKFFFARLRGLLVR